MNNNLKHLLKSLFSAYDRKVDEKISSSSSKNFLGAENAVSVNNNNLMVNVDGFTSENLKDGVHIITPLLFNDNTSSCYTLNVSNTGIKPLKLGLYEGVQRRQLRNNVLYEIVFYNDSWIIINPGFQFPYLRKGESGQTIISCGSCYDPHWGYPERLSFRHSDGKCYGVMMTCNCDEVALLPIKGSYPTSGVRMSLGSSNYPYYSVNAQYFYKEGVEIGNIYHLKPYVLFSGMLNIADSSARDIVSNISLSHIINTHTCRVRATMGYRCHSGITYCAEYGFAECLLLKLRISYTTGEDNLFCQDNNTYVDHNYDDPGVCDIVVGTGPGLCGHYYNVVGLNGCNGKMYITENSGILHAKNIYGNDINGLRVWALMVDGSSYKLSLTVQLQSQPGCTNIIRIHKIELLPW